MESMRDIMKRDDNYLFICDKRKEVKCSDRLRITDEEGLILLNVFGRRDNNRDLKCFY